MKMKTILPVMAFTMMASTADARQLGSGININNLDTTVSPANDFCCGIASGSVKLTELNTKAAAPDTQKAIDDAIAAFKAGTLKVFDVSKDNYITVKGEKLTKYAADVDDMGDFKADTHVIWDGAFLESYFRSAPYFDVDIDGITSLVKD